MYVAFVYFEPWNRLGTALNVALIDLARVADDERAERGTADHQQLERLKHRAQMPAGERVSPENRPDHEHVADKD